MIYTYPPTIILRHRRENLKKCSLRTLEERSDFLFFRYPLRQVPPYENYIFLTLDAPAELSFKDRTSGLLLLDATWRLAERMSRNLPLSERLIKRRLPHGIITAYPRRQEDCKEPLSGLASIEALYCAYLLMGRKVDGLLEEYYWKDSFLEKNSALLLHYSLQYEI